MRNTSTQLLLVMNEVTHVLTTVNKIVEKRDQTHGNFDDNLTMIANLWGTYLGVEISAAQVANCMTMLKIARSAFNPTVDDYLDMVGYSAIAAALHEKKNK